MSVGADRERATAGRVAKFRTAPDSIERLYTKEEAAALLNVSPRFMKRCVYERRIRFVKVGRLVRIPHSAISEMLTSGAVNRID